MRSIPAGRVWVAMCLLAAAPAAAETVRIEAARDATLVESEAGEIGHGSGPFFYVGRTAQREGSIRRALLSFDVAERIPPRAVIESVSLTLFLWPSNVGMMEIRLLPVTRDWSEGPAFSSGGLGAEAGPGDVTWLHTTYPEELWARPGGDTRLAAPTVLTVDREGAYTWSDPPGLRATVERWRRAPERNFGWLLVGNESVPQNAKSFASREHPEPTIRPTLEITYRIPERRRGPGPEDR